MTAPTIQVLAAQIATGNYSGLPIVDYWKYESDEWEAAAQYALDTEDYSDLAYMVSREEAYDYFVKQGEAFLDRWGGFDDWYVAIGHRMFPEAEERNAA